MAFSSLGFSLPDLSITGVSAPAASWGSTLSVTVDLKNTGASTINEPLALAPGSQSTADAAPTTVSVFASPRRNSHRQVLIGTFATPYLPQNDVVQLTNTLTLPSQPAGFPGDGGTIYLRFVVNRTHNVVESDITNNSFGKVPVLIEAPFPQLEAVALDVPPTMNPGDTIQPNIEVANLGPASTAPQGPVTVELVASVDQTFGPGSSIIGVYTIPNIPGISTVPSRSQTFGVATLDTPNNVVTINATPVTLPTSPASYFIGVVVDPANQIKQLGKIGNVSTNKNNPFMLIQKVGPNTSGLPPAGVINSAGGATNPLFPFPVQIPTTFPVTAGRTITSTARRR